MLKSINYFSGNAAFLNEVVRQGFINVATQLTMMSLGFQDSFNVKSLLTSMASVGAKELLGDALGLDFDATSDNVAIKLVQTMGMRLAESFFAHVAFGAPLDLEMILAESLGSVIGQEIGAKITETLEEDFGLQRSSDKLEGRRTKTQDAKQQAAESDQQGVDHTTMDTYCERTHEQVLIDTDTDDITSFDQLEQMNDRSARESDIPASAAAAAAAEAPAPVPVMKPRDGDPDVADKNKPASVRKQEAEEAVQHEYEEKVQQQQVQVQRQAQVEQVPPPVQQQQQQDQTASLISKEEGASLALDLIPFVGEAKSFAELITGRDLVTGEEVNRWMAAAGAVPFVGKLTKVGKVAKTGAKIATKATKNAPELVKSAEVIVDAAKTSGKVADDAAATLAKNAPSKTAKTTGEKVSNARGRNQAKKKSSRPKSKMREDLKPDPEHKKATRARANELKSQGKEFQKLKAEFKRQAADDPNLPKEVRNWLKQQYKQKGNWRDVKNPPGYDIDHTRNDVDFMRFQNARDNRSRGGVLGGHYEAVRTVSQPPARSAPPLSGK